MCNDCEECLNTDAELVICGKCGKVYMMHNSTFCECKLIKNERGNIVAFIEGKPVELNSEEKEVIKSFEIIRKALPFSGVLKKGEKPPVRTAMPFPGTENLLFS